MSRSVPGPQRQRAGEVVAVDLAELVAAGDAAGSERCCDEPHRRSRPARDAPLGSHRHVEPGGLRRSDRVVARCEARPQGVEVEPAGGFELVARPQGARRPQRGSELIEVGAGAAGMPDESPGTAAQPEVAHDPGRPAAAIEQERRLGERRSRLEPSRCDRSVVEQQRRVGVAGEPLSEQQFRDAAQQHVVVAPCGYVRLACAVDLVAGRELTATDRQPVGQLDAALVRAEHHRVGAGCAAEELDQGIDCGRGGRGDEDRTTVLDGVEGNRRDRLRLAAAGRPRDHGDRFGPAAHYRGALRRA